MEKQVEVCFGIIEKKNAYTESANIASMDLDFDRQVYLAKNQACQAFFG
jgi:hypothetical protein